MQHLDEGTIHAWLDGALAPDESRRAEEHVASCKACAALVAEARGLIAAASRILLALDDVPSGVIPVHAEGEIGVPDELATLRARKAAESVARRRPRSRMPWMAAAAILLVAVGTLTVVQRGGVPAIRNADEATSTAASAVVGSAGAPSASSTPAVTAPPVPTPAAERVSEESRAKEALRNTGRKDAIADKKQTVAEPAVDASRAGARLERDAVATDRRRDERVRENKALNEVEQRRDAPRQPQSQQAQQRPQSQLQAGSLADAQRQLVKADSTRRSSLDSLARNVAPSAPAAKVAADTLASARPAAVVTGTAAASRAALTSGFARDRELGAPGGRIFLFAGCYQIEGNQRPVALPARIELDTAVARTRADTVWYLARSLEVARAPVAELSWRTTGASTVDLSMTRNAVPTTVQLTFPEMGLDVVVTGAMGSTAKTVQRAREANVPQVYAAKRIVCR
jgi:hypothetical protein